MKISKLLRTTALLVAPWAFCALPASAYTVTINDDLENPGFNIYDHIAVDDQGNIFAIENCNVDWHWVSDYDEEGNYIGEYYAPYEIYGDPTFRGVKTSAETFTLPDEVKFVVAYDRYGTQETAEFTRPICRFEIDNYTENDGISFGNGSLGGFPGCDNLKNFIVPDNYYYCGWHGSGFAAMPNFYFTSTEVPDMMIDSNYITILVDETLYDLYADRYGDRVKNSTPAVHYDINVAAGELASTINALGLEFGQIRDLAITGSLTEEELVLIRRMSRLEKLDLSGVTGLSTFMGCANLRYLESCKLPEGITTIGAKAFYECSRLGDFTLPSSVTTIGNDAFYNCKSLTAVELGSVTEIGSGAFRDCNLKSVDLSKLTRIEGAVFAGNNNLDNVVFGDCLENIGGSAFEACDFKTIVIPNSVKDLEAWSFNYNRNLKTITLGSGLTYISNAAFASTTPETIYVNYIFPLSESGFVYTDLSNATAYVPSLTYNEFVLSEAWVDFANIQPYDAVISEIKIRDRQFTIKENAANCIAENAEVKVEYQGELIVDAPLKLGNVTLVDGGILALNKDTEIASLSMEMGGTLECTETLKAESINLGSFSNLRVNNLTVADFTASSESRFDIYGQGEFGNYKHFGRYENEYYWGEGEFRYSGNTVIPEDKVTAENVDLNLNVRTDRWFFITFPYDINVKDITPDRDNALWVVRKYSGKDRAELTGNTWQNMTDGDVLKAGQGYILHCYCEDSEWVNFTFPAAGNPSDFFTCEPVQTELATYASEFPHNASWNLVGNSYPAFVNMQGVEFDAPVTVWEDNNYYAYSPLDDEYVFKPFQAFFVQGGDITGSNALVINPAFRAHSKEEAAAKAPARIADNSGRAIFNLHIAGESGRDRARVVVNSEAEMGYEGNRDASKFMSSEANVPQIFVNNAGNRLAIDERPLADGEFTLGARIGQKGEYTVSLETRNAEGYEALLTDNTTGITTDILSEEYVFTADAATDNSRFTLTLKNIANAADMIAASAISINANGGMLSVNAPAAVEITVATVDGKIVASGKSSSFNTRLEAGIYVVKAGSKVAKISVK